MKKRKMLSVLLTLVFVITLFSPVAQAASIPDEMTAPMSKEVTHDVYSIRGLENNKVRFNIFLNNQDNTGQFAIIYQDSPEYVYEFVFDLRSIPSNSTIPHDFWESVREYCFANKASWTKTHVPSAVTIIDESELNSHHEASTTKSDETDYFEDWLIDKYGPEYSGNPITSKTQNGVTMYLKSGFQVYAYKDHTYVLNQTMTVVGFATAILGFSASHPIIGVLGIIAGTHGLFNMGQKVYEYRVRANWFKYATCVSGTGYPYGLTDKFTYFNGYCYSDTGTCNVDEASESTSYVPSATIYNSNTNIFNSAFDEYDRIGFQSGNF